MMDDYNGIPPKVVETLATQVSDVEISSKTETEEDNSPLCPICGKSCSTGKTQVWNGKMYHHECLSKCSVCQKSHATLSFMGGSMYCEPCKNKFLRGEVDTNATEEAPDMSDGAKVLADESASAPETRKNASSGATWDPWLT